MAKKEYEISDELNTVFDKCPFTTISKFEIDNFRAQAGTGFARNVIETINRIRKIQSDLENETGSFEKLALEDERNKLIEHLNKQDITALRSAVENWEHVEREYWVNILGKQAAIEILTFGRPSVETMAKMVRLPEELYIKATQICVRLANAIKSTTMAAEEQIGLVDPNKDHTETDTAAVNKLNLKKK